MRGTDSGPDQLEERPNLNKCLASLGRKWWGSAEGSSEKFGSKSSPNFQPLSILSSKVPAWSCLLFWA